jgi:hypothetical protein
VSLAVPHAGPTHAGPPNSVARVAGRRHPVGMTLLLKPPSVDVVAAERAARQQTPVAEGSVRQQLS